MWQAIFHSKHSHSLVYGVLRMKKSLLAVAAVTAFAGAAQAQSSVTVYGIIDVGVMGATNSPNLNSSPWAESGSPYLSANQKTTSGTGQAFGMMTGGESMNRLGFKGSEDLGGGTKAIFDMEMGLNGNGSIANGNAGVSSGNKANEQAGDTALQGQLFGRALYAGLSSDKYGQLTAGRQQNLMLDNIGAYDPVNAQLFSPINFSGTYGGGGYTDNSRVTGLKYVDKIAGFNVNAIYAPGGISGQSTAGTSSGFQVGYEANKFGVQAIASHTTDAQALSGISAGTSLATATANTVSYAAVNGMTVAPSNAVQMTVSNTTAYMLTAKYKPLEALTLKAGYERENIGTPSNFALFANTPTTASGYTVASVAANAYNYSQNVAWGGANYQFTPTIKGSLGYYYVSTLSYAGKIGGGTSQYFSALADYSLSKRTNLYAGVMANNNSASNGYVAAASNTNTAGTNLITTSVTYGLGMRHTF